MMSKQDRESILDGMKALKRVCLKIEKESVRCQKVMVNRRSFTVTWMLGFDDELLAFDASVKAISADSSSSRDDEMFIDLGDYLRDRLNGLKEHEPWPDTIPESWLAGAAYLARSLLP